MEDLIKRSDAIRLAEQGQIQGFEWQFKKLCMLPSAEPDVIRCKNCKHLQKWRSEVSAEKFGQIYECARSVLGCPKPEDFCSYAERRGDSK